jgi:mRNA interferase HicA
MKYSTFHRLILRNGWVFLYAKGSHYHYRKEEITYPVPFHGSKEMPEGLRRKIIKEMGLKV